MPALREAVISPEVACAGLLDLLVARRPRDWVSLSAAADSGTRLRGRYIDSAVHDLTVQTVRGYGVRAVTPGGLLFAADIDPRPDLVDQLSGSVAGSRESTVDAPLTLPDLAPLRAWLAAADEAARSWDPAVRQLVIEFDVVQRTAWIGLPDLGVQTDDRGLAYLVLRAIAGRGERVATGFYTPGVHGTLAELDPVAAGREVAKRAVHGLSARPAPVGSFPVVIGGGRGIVLLHEACCHPLEGDEVLRGSVYANAAGSRVGGPQVSIVDDPAVAGAVGSYEIDDEGVPAQRTVLVGAGELSGILTDRETAHRLGAPRTGNGRCNSMLHPPLPRMSNTCLVPGDASPADIIADTPYGIYAEHVGGGEVVEATGQFVFRVTNGYLIENGRIGDPILETTIGGTGSSVLAGIDAVGDDPTVGAARCGKFGQWVPVGVVGPTLRVGSLFVGGTVQ